MCTATVNQFILYQNKQQRTKEVKSKEKKTEEIKRNQKKEKKQN